MWEVAWSNADVICLSNYVGQSRMPLQSQEIRCALRSCCSVTLPSDPHTLVAEQCSLRKPCWFADSFLLVDKWEYILSYMTCFIVRLTGNGWCFEPFLWIGVTFALVQSLGSFPVLMDMLNIFCEWFMSLYIVLLQQGLIFPGMHVVRSTRFCGVDPTKCFVDFLFTSSSLLEGMVKFLHGEVNWFMLSLVKSSNWMQWLNLSATSLNDWSW